MKTITVPCTGKPPTRGTRIFLDPHGSKYLLPSGCGSLSQAHSVGLCVGTVGSVSDGTATVHLLESHPGAAFIEELVAENHLQLTTNDAQNCSHLTLTQSPGSFGLQESLVTLMESKMQMKVPTHHARLIVRDIVSAASFTNDQKLTQIRRFLNAINGRRRLTESATRRSTAGAKPRRIADILRGCQRSSVSLQESAQPTRFDSIQHILRHCR
jgi:hypothetical protein